MSAQQWQFTNTGLTKILDGTLASGDTYKCALFLSTSNLGPASTTYATVTNEHANANGYTTGGASVSLSLSGTNPVTVDFAVDPSWNASGGPITARFAAIYEVGGNILAYCLLDDTPADVTALDGNPFTVAAHASGLWTLATA